VEALTFGPRAELLAVAKEQVQTLRGNGNPQAHLYGESELGGLGYMCILPESASLYGLPDAPRFATMNVLGQWLSGLVTAGVIAAVPLWLLFRRREELAAKKKPEGGGE
jgi:formate dehydrogenase iron-sulfur subunit